MHRKHKLGKKFYVLLGVAILALVLALTLNLYLQHRRQVHYEAVKQEQTAEQQAEKSKVNTEDKSEGARADPESGEPEGDPAKGSESKSPEEEKEDATKETEGENQKGKLTIQEGSAEGTASVLPDFRDFQVVGSVDRLTEITGMSPEKMVQDLRSWLDENGLTGAIGIAFYDELKVAFSEEKYTLDLQVLFGDSGNGTEPENKQVIISMNYYRNTDKYEFYK